MTSQVNKNSGRSGAPRCLIALEFGGNFGHLSRCIALANQLRDLGCEVLFAAPDSRTAFQILASQGFSFVQAPRVRGHKRTKAHPINYADLLLQKGFSDPEALSAAVQSWRSVFALFQPDILVSDFSPTALLAARVCALPTVALGSGFFIPPNVSPWPSIRPWDSIPIAQLQAADDALLVAVNGVLNKWRRPAMQTVLDLFGDTLRILATFAELDHYGTRPGEQYAGVFYGLDAGRKVDWPAGEGKRVLAYLRPDVPGFGVILQCLRASAHRIVVAAPGTHGAHVQRFSAGHLLFSNTPIALGPLLESADLAIGYGSIGFVTQTLRAGLPQLMLPPYVEQALFARQVSALGAGETLADQRDSNTCAQAIESLLEEPHYRHAAKSFAARHATYNANSIIEQLALQIVGGETATNTGAAADLSKDLSSAECPTPAASPTSQSQSTPSPCPPGEGGANAPGKGSFAPLASTKNGARL